MRIQTRVFLTILLSSILLVTVMVLMMQWSINRGFIEYVNARQRADFMPMAKTFERLYEQDRWQRLKQDPKWFDRILRDENPEQRRPPPPRPGGRSPPERHQQPRPPAIPPVTLVDRDHHIVGGPGQRFEHASKIPLNSGEETIGWLLLPRTDRLTRGFDVRFQSQQQTMFLVIGGVVIALATIVALLFAPTIIRPIRQIAEATNQIANKAYDVELDSRRRDELGDLARDINELALTLKRSDAMQRRWLADTSHELRTPVSIIRGEIEAMLDGVRPLTMDNLESLKQEVLHLHKLIEDLSDLSNADMGSLRYHKELLDVNALLSGNAGHYELLCEERGLSFRFEPAGEPANVYGDAARLQQLFGNLIANSSKYTDPPGEVTFAITRDESCVVVTLEDTAPGVPPQALDRLFDYLYRVESSRNRNTGGAGLGLAIAARIVEAHKGEIEASHSPKGGIKMIVRLPLDRHHDNQ